MKKKLLMISVAAVMIFTMLAFAGCGSSDSEDTASKDTIIIGLDDTFAPMGFRDEDGNPSVCIAINEDITKSLELERYLHSRNRVDTDQPNEDKYRGDVNDMLQHLMDQAQLMVGKNSAHMTK